MRAALIAFVSGQETAPGPKESLNNSRAAENAVNVVSTVFSVLSSLPSVNVPAPNAVAALTSGIPSVNFTAVIYFEAMALPLIALTRAVEVVLSPVA